jgi:antitoxin (DNA-binding transcriptional repressor) of toxin-antitoxin stability system
MARIGRRELRQHASRHLEQVKAEGMIEVADPGSSPVSSPTAPVAARGRLIAPGLLVPAKRAFRPPEHRRVGSEERTATEVPAEPRDDHLT